MLQWLLQSRLKTLIMKKQFRSLYLSLGSNINADENLSRAVALLSEYFSTSPELSAVYKTDPQDFIDQPPFLNCVILIETSLKPLEILKITQSIEEKLNRERDKNIPKGPRTIDIDILLYGNIILNDPILTIPHPAMSNRAFVLVPLLDITKDLKNPLTGVKYCSILEKVNDQGVYRYPLDLYNLRYDGEKPRIPPKQI